MNGHINVSLLIIITLVWACSPAKQATNTENWTENAVNDWFNKKEWMGGVKLHPDSSINKKEFAVQYHRNKQRYDQAFAFLKKNNLMELTVGDHELDGRNVFVKVSAYNSKNGEETFFETHRNYTDIQLVLSGTENIGSADSAGITEKTPYDKEKDIQFYKVNNLKNHFAAPDTQELYAQIGQLRVENEFLKKSFKRLGG